MAATYKGLFLELGLNNDGILKGLRETDEKLRGTKKELNALEKSLKIKWDNKTFDEAQKLAKKRLEETTKKAELLKKAIAEIESQGMGKVSDEFKELQKRLKDTEKSAQIAKAQLNNLADLKLNSLAQRIDNIGSKISGLGQKMVPLSAAASAGLGMAAKSAIDYEKAFIGVSKTVNATSEQLNQLSGEIRKTSTEIPVSAVELANMAQAAGQLGIKTENIMGFTRTIADLGLSSNLAGEEGATMLAKFATVSNMPQDQFDRLGAAVVDLGNNSNATEREIMEMATRLVGAGTTAGMTQSQILGISTALSSVGLEAEAGGSAYSKLINEINAAVATGSNSVKDFAQVAGMSAKQFSETFKNDASDAVVSFVEGLKKYGKESIVVLNEMGIEEIRMRDAILRTSNAGDELRQSITRSNVAWEQNTALAKEAEKVHNSTWGQLERTKGQIIDVSIEIGNMMLPTIRDLANDVKDATTWFTNLNDSTQKTVLKAIAVAAAAAPVMLAIGGVIKGISGIITGLKAAQAGLVAFKAANDAATISQAALNAVLNVNPYVLCATLLTGFVAALVSFSSATGTSIEDAKEFDKTLNDLSSTFDTAEKSIKETEEASLAELSVVEKSIPRLEELAGKTNKTAQEKAEMARIVENLNKAMPELRAHVDSETGALNVQISTIWRAVDAYKALARAKAAEQLIVESEKGAMKTRTAVEDNLKDARVMLDAKKKAEQTGKPMSHFLPDNLKDLSLSDLNDRDNALREKQTKFESDSERYAKIAAEERVKTDANMPKTPKKDYSPPKFVGSSKKGGSRKKSSKSSSNSDAERKAEEARKDRVERFDQNIEDTETWNQNHYDKLKAQENLSDEQELKSIEARRGRYKKYAQDVLKLTFMTEDEKLKHYKDYTQKAEKLDQDAIKMKRDIQKESAKAWMDNVDETERWNKRHYDNRKKLDDLTEDEEIQSIKDRRDRYIKYSNDIMKVEGLTNDEKIKKQREYREQAEDIEIELYEFKKSIKEQEIQLAKDKMNEMLQLGQGRLQRELESARKALSEQEQAEIESVNKRIEAQEKLLQTKISAIDEELAARRRLREDADQDGKIAEIQKKIQATQSQLTFARGTEAEEQLQRELMRQQEELKDALQSKEDTEFERQKQAEKDAINAEIERLRQQAQAEQEAINQKYADQVAQQESATARKEAEYTSRIDAQTAYATQAAKINNYNNSNSVVNHNSTTNNPTIVLNHTLPATYAANLANKIMRG